MKDLIKDLKFIITASNDCEKDNRIEQLILDYIKQVETEKQLSIHVVSSSALIGKAEQMQKENEQLTKDARGHWNKEYQRAIGIGIDRIIKLIKRHYC